LRLKILKKF